MLRVKHRWTHRCQRRDVQHTKIDRAPAPLVNRAVGVFAALEEVTAIAPHPSSRRSAIVGVGHIPATSITQCNETATHFSTVTVQPEPVNVALSTVWPWPLIVTLVTVQVDV